MVGKIAVFLYTHDFPGSLELLDWLKAIVEGLEGVGLYGGS